MEQPQVPRAAPNSVRFIKQEKPNSLVWKIAGSNQTSSEMPPAQNAPGERERRVIKSEPQNPLTQRIADIGQGLSQSARQANLNEFAFELTRMRQLKSDYERMPETPNILEVVKRLGELEGICAKWIESEASKAPATAESPEYMKALELSGTIRDWQKKASFEEKVENLGFIALHGSQLAVNENQLMCTLPIALLMQVGEKFLERLKEPDLPQERAVSFKCDLKAIESKLLEIARNAHHSIARGEALGAFIELRMAGMHALLRE